MWNIPEPKTKTLLIFFALWAGCFFLLSQGWNPSDSPTRRLVFDALAWTVILIGLYGTLHYGRRAWRLEDTPIARVRSAHQGYVELYGQARLMEGPPILAPLSHLPCAWYRFQVEARSSADRWWVVDAGESENLFLLDDGTGQCVIDPYGADFIKTRRDVWYGNASGARTHAAFGIGAAYRYVEQRILPNEDIHAIGLFRTVGGLQDAPDTRQEVAELLESWKRDPKQMALFDRRGNGRVDPDEWEAARRAAHIQVRRRQLRRSVEPEIPMLVDPRDATRPFIIAAFREEGRLINYFRWQSVGSLLAACGAAAFLLSH